MRHLSTRMDCHRGQSNRPEADCVSTRAMNECDRMWNADMLLRALRVGLHGRINAVLPNGCDRSDNRHRRMGVSM